MRALQLTELSGPDGLELAELPEPEASHMLTPGEGVVVDVKAAAVSFPDVLQTRGLYQYKPDLPFVPGAEVAGVVRSAPKAQGCPQETAWPPSPRSAALRRPQSRRHS